MIRPVLQDEALLADIRGSNRDDGHFRLWWLGQSGFLLQGQDRHVLLDPYLSDSLTAKYAHTDTPHVRLTERAIDPARLDFIDLVTASHAHTDHLDPDTLRPVLCASPGLVLVVPEACRSVASARAGGPVENLVGLDDGLSAMIGDFRITGIASAHESVDRDDLGRCRYLGYVVEFGGWTVYHSGDTVLYDGLIDKLRRFPIDLALLPINGRRPERRVPGNLDPVEAAWLGKQIGARTVVPCHYEMFAFNTARPEAFAAAALDLGQRHLVLRCAERWDSVQWFGTKLPAR